METNTFPTAEVMRYRTCMKIIPENIFETIKEAADNGDEWISFEDEFNIMTKEVIWALKVLGYEIFSPLTQSDPKKYTIRWFN